MSIAAVQQQLRASGVGSIEVAPYLSRLCETLATLMIGDFRPISLKVIGEKGVATSRALFASRAVEMQSIPGVRSRRVSGGESYFGHPTLAIGQRSALP